MAVASVVIAVHARADSFWRAAALASVGPLVAAVVGGLAVGLIIQRVQSRREFVTLRTELSLDMMRTAYAFYTRLIEVIRQEHYGQHPARDELAGPYEDFRIAARVIEAKLHAYFSDEVARYLWHGVVYMLSVRYYRLIYGADGKRTLDMMAVHGQHPGDEGIPATARALFLTLPELRDDNTVMRRFEEMLNNAVYLVLRRRLDPSAGGDVILQPGRGSRILPPARKTR